MDEPPIRRLEDEWHDAILAHDEAALRAILHPDFRLVGIRSTGTVAVGIDLWLELLSRMEIEQFSIDVTDVQHHGPTAIATVQGDWRITLDGRAIDENFLLTDVWVDAPGLGWRVARRHSSPYPKS